jgi:hypothetical protein
LTLDDHVVNCIIKAYDLIDSLEILVSHSFYCKGTYTLVAWDKADDEKFKEFSYLLEQETFVGTYVDERRQFEKDWDAGE